MNNLKHWIRIYLMVSFIYWAGCPGSSDTPTIMLSAVDCAKNDITIEATKSVSGSASNWVVSIEVLVKCNGTPLSGAELKFNPWVGQPVKLTTDNQGKTTHRVRVTTSDRPTESVKVTIEIEGSDGTKTESITVP